ncbi:MAG: sugar phosphate isomerase/epimerase [Oculatellaceae cyanobacterium Prado106]|jgi:sugar phosphate isomerase/epimerase|nr:sugar phosphate isomerase/epimerase [Oculatellaceae cyanobacterium Prado106]
MINLWLSLSAYGGLSTRRILETYQTAGIRFVELAIGPKPDPDTAEAIAAYRQCGFQYRAHHAFVWGDRHSPFNLSDDRIDWSSLQARIDWMATLGITAYSVHAGHYAWDGDRTLAYERFLQNLERLHFECYSAGITLGVETMYSPAEPRPYRYLLDSVESIHDFLQTLPAIKLVLDLAHLNIGYGNERSTLLSMLFAESDRLLEIHLSDNDGKQDLHSKITPETWWIPWCNSLPKQIPLILESRMNRKGSSFLRQEVERIQHWLQGGNERSQN